MELAVLRGARALMDRLCRRHRSALLPSVAEASCLPPALPCPPSVHIPCPLPSALCPLPSALCPLPSAHILQLSPYSLTLSLPSPQMAPQRWLHEKIRVSKQPDLINSAHGDMSYQVAGLNGSPTSTRTHHPHPRRRDGPRQDAADISLLCWLREAKGFTGPSSCPRLSRLSPTVHEFANWAPCSLLHFHGEMRRAPT